VEGVGASSVRGQGAALNFMENAIFRMLVHFVMLDGVDEEK
jgi:hypothetical protein